MKEKKKKMAKKWEKRSLIRKLLNLGINQWNDKKKKKKSPVRKKIENIKSLRLK